MENKEKDENVKKEKKKKNVVKIIIIVLVVCIIICGVGIAGYFLYNNKEKSEPTTIKTDNEGYQAKNKLKMSGNSLEDFDLKFLQLENDNKNIIYSPISIKYALEMLADGAKGKTKSQIDAVIGEYNAKKYTNSANMSFANAMFIRDSFKDNVKKAYIDKLMEKYSAEVLFDSFETPNIVNDWASNKTLGLIKNLVDDLSDEQFVLVNALAIDMEWNKLIQATCANYKDGYSVKYNHEDYSDYIGLICGDLYETLDFNNNSSKVKSLKFGASINRYDIINDLGENNIRNTIKAEYEEWLSTTGGCGENDLPSDQYVDKFVQELKENYGKEKGSTDFLLYSDDDVKMFAKDLKEYDGVTLQYIGIMPKTKSIDQFIKEADAKTLNNYISQLKDIKAENFAEGKITKVVGATPLFNFDYSLNLINDLKDIGIESIFDEDEADLSNITSSEGIYIGSATHKANIEFSNEGIKAAAATTVGGLGSTGCWFEHLYKVPVETIDLTFNNPYIFIIRDKNSGESWFVGKVYQPTPQN